MRFPQSTRAICEGCGSTFTEITVEHRSCFGESVIRIPVAITTIDRINGQPIGSGG
jgi:hypothetical protein